MNRNDVTEQTAKCADPTRTFIAVTSFVSLVLFMQWCVLDFYVVRMIPYPEQVHKYHWTCLMFPILPSLALFAWSRRVRSALTFSVIVWAMGTGIVLFIPIIATFGVWFHLSIGGQF